MKARLLTVFVLAVGLIVALLWAVGVQAEIAPAQKENVPSVIPQMVEYPQANDAPAAVSGAAALAKVIEFVDAPRQCSQMTDRSLALDGAGNPHIACGRDGLYYFRHDGTEWHQETVVAAGRVGMYASLALEPTAPYTPHISYRDSRGGSLKYAHLTATGWVTEVVDSGNAGDYSSLALDPNGDPHISYHVGWPMNELRYARLIAGNWVTQTVDDGGSFGSVGYNTSLALEPTTPYTPHIGYWDIGNTNLKYAYLTASGWVSETVDDYGTAGQYASLALAPTAPYTPHISYKGTGSTLKHAYLGATGWVSQVVDSTASVGFYTSLALDGDGRAHISYRDHTNGSLKYTYNAEGSLWKVLTVDTAGSSYTSLALEPTAPFTPHVSYYVAGDLKYAVVDTTGWVSQVVRTGDDVGSYGSLALEPTAPFTPHISYHESLAGDLKYAYRTADGWVSVTVEISGDVGEYTSLALEPTAPFTPHISYYDSTNGNLKYAHLTASGWVSETVDASGDVGEHTSLVLDGDGYPHISYNDNTFGNLKYAHLTASGWVSETVDGSATVDGGSTSLVLEPTAPYTPHISYYGNGNLKYAYWTGSVWVSETVDASGDTGEYSSLALDASGNPHIGYYDSDNDHPKYAYWGAGGWVSETIDSGGDGGDHIAMVLDSGGSPHVCYIDTNGPYHLEYARRTGSGWTLEMVDSSDGVGEYCSLELDGNGHPHMSYHDSYRGDLKYAHLPGSMVYLPLVLRNQ